MRFLAAVATACTLGAAALPAQAGPFSNVYFFGDSLTDTGNVQAVYASLLPSPVPPGMPLSVPGAPYDGGRFSNGPVYAEVLAQGLGLGAQPAVLGGTNYAFGGARTGYQVSGPPFQGIGQQVQSFIDLPGAADSQALYVLWAGSNNLQDLLAGRQTDVVGNPIPTVAQTLLQIGGYIRALYDEGARYLLVPNVPNLGRVPRVSALGPQAQAGATLLALAFDSGLDELLSQLEGDPTLPDLDLIRFDTYAVLEDVATRPAAYGLTNVADRCYSGDDLGFTGGGSVCASPDQYLFWDGLHPTAAVHQVLGQEMLASVRQAVPEPGSASLAAAALAGLVLLRGRRRAAPAAPTVPATAA